MGCKVGYPESPCPYNMDPTRVTRSACGPCKEYEPPRHILKFCGLWERENKLCMKPRSACETCPEKAERPAADRQPEDRRAYDKEYRQKAKETIAESRERFFDKHPHYMRDYMRAYRAKLKGNGNDGNSGSGSGEV